MTLVMALIALRGLKKLEDNQETGILVDANSQETPLA
jgi:hypothetical protein